MRGLSQTQSLSDGECPGLYLCRKLAELQGGGILFNGASGQGASFCFFIEARLADNAPSVITPYSMRTSERFSKNGLISPGLSATMALPAKGAIPKNTPFLELPKAEQTDYFSVGFAQQEHSNGKLEKLEKSHSENQDRAKLHVLIVEDNVRFSDFCAVKLLTCS